MREERSSQAEGRSGAKALRQEHTWHIGGRRRNPGEQGSGRDGARELGRELTVSAAFRVTVKPSL